MKDKVTNKTKTDKAWPAVAVKPQSVKNTMGHGHNTFTPGKAPRGGFTAVWDYSGKSGDYKNSPTTKPDKKVY